MSYNVRDDNAILGPNAYVELPNGAGASTLAKLQVIEPVVYFSLAAPTAGTYSLFVSPPLPSNASVLQPLGGKFQVAGASVVYSTGSTSGTLALEICPAGTANGSGTNVLSTTSFNIAQGTNAGSSTPYNLTLNTNVDNLQMTDNSRINMILGGTLTSLASFCLVIYLIRA